LAPVGTLEEAKTPAAPAAQTPAAPVAQTPAAPVAQTPVAQTPAVPDRVREVGTKDRSFSMVAEATYPTTFQADDMQSGSGVVLSSAAGVSSGDDWVLPGELQQTVDFDPSLIRMVTPVSDRDEGGGRVTNFTSGQWRWVGSGRRGIRLFPNPLWEVLQIGRLSCGKPFPRGPW
ncbi:MAG: hypothetical protein HQL74_13585, partial [Magnetococcales bacterium]|nr:hypothetical protein [Magnetococcales bacterium]